MAPSPSSSQTTRPPLRVQEADGSTSDRFVTDFTIGRDADCAVTIDSGLVSRRHAHVFFQGGAWQVEDLDSTNGLYVDGERTRTLVLDGPTTLQFGIDGPCLHLRPAPSGFDAGDASGVDDTDATSSGSDPSSDSAEPPSEVPSMAAGSSSAPSPRPSRSRRPVSLGPVPDPADSTNGVVASGDDAPAASARSRGPSAPREDASSSVRGADPASSDGDESGSAGDIEEPATDAPRRSVTAYLDHYFEGESSSGGAHTQLLRQAYQRARHTERSWFLVVLAGVLGVCLLLAGVALWQYQQREQVESRAHEVFNDVKRLDLALAQLRLALDGEASIDEQLDRMEQERRALLDRYSGYVQELGLYRRLSAEEKLIHNTARVFRESEFSMPAGFVREVRLTIDTYWRGPGRARYTQAVARAQENGYVEPIVEALMRRGLPPELFYLALQESDFRVDAIGPRTRWGIAKGMWQFIPSTARRFGLAIGPREDDRVVDPDDERHDFRKATDAAARYLQTIYTTDAQASGLLVVASYNWGEHRVNRKLNQMPAGIPEEALKGLDATPDARNYWRFLTEYRNRMPQETRDYVLRVFAAAVIGQDPRHFGFDFDDPLQAAIESAGARLVSTATPPSAS